MASNAERAANFRARQKEKGERRQLNLWMLAEAYEKLKLKGMQFGHLSLGETIERMLREDVADEDAKHRQQVADLKHEIKRLKESRDYWRDMRSGGKKPIHKRDYNKVKRCIHPDSFQNTTKEMATEAFAIFENIASHLLEA